jgi:hypothetical protein
MTDTVVYLVLLLVQYGNLYVGLVLSIRLVTKHWNSEVKIKVTHGLVHRRLPTVYIPYILHVIKRASKLEAMWFVRAGIAPLMFCLFCTRIIIIIVTTGNVLFWPMIQKWKNIKTFLQSDWYSGAYARSYKSDSLMCRCLFYYM